jgi:enterochelin esterase-like enzyme
MKKSLFLFAIIAILASCTNPTIPEAPFSESNLEVTSGNLWHADIFSPELNETIKIDVWTPKGYTDSKKYPVIYMHDGQNLFDANSTWNHQAWEIDSVLGSLIADKKVKPAIVVGIHSVDTTR